MPKNKKTDDHVIGHKIVQVRPMTEKEMQEQYWDRPATVIVLDNGTKLYPSRDEEGNDPGCIFGTYPDGAMFSCY
jgi:hypothetical protein